MTALLTLADLIVRAAMAGILVGAVAFSGVLLAEQVQQIRGRS